MANGAFILRMCLTLCLMAGHSYRFRLVSLSCDPNYVFSIDDHDLTVIEADGIETNPVAINAIQIFAAQRYSFVVRVSTESSCPCF